MLPSDLKFIWVPQRRKENLAAQGVDFEVLYKFTFDPAKVRQAPWTSAETQPRHVAIAPVGRTLYVLLFIVDRRRARVVGLRRASQNEVDHYGRADIDRPTDAEEEAIQAGIAAEPDNPEWTAEDFTAAGAPSQTLLHRVRRLESRAVSTKQLVSLQIDKDVLERLMLRGTDWRAQINTALRAWVGLDPA
jgi:uncharacterized protein (DUF4415 family)